MGFLRYFLVVIAIAFAVYRNNFLYNNVVGRVVGSNNMKTIVTSARRDLRMNNYFFRAWSGENFPVTGDLPPFQVMKRYIQQHSQKQLEREWNECKTKQSCAAIQNRSFIVGMYSCPVESGNRLHSFMNALLWAVVTNRTILARYETAETCQEYDEGNADQCSRKHEYSTPSHCKNVLHLSNWVPNYDKWNETLGLPQIEQADYALPGNYTLPYDNPTNPKVMRTGKQVKPDNLQLLRPGNDKTKQEYLSMPSNLGRLQSLGYSGPYFAYGMMFEALFTMDPSLLSPPNSSSPTVKPPSPHVQSYFLHSRHPQGKGMDKYTFPEELCIDKLANETNPEKPCLIYLMSDREVTLKLLENIIHNKTHCRVSIAQNRSTGQSFSDEHGSFAGRGYWQDVALASQARNGMIAFHMYHRDLVRTSTALVRELVEFRRVLENGVNQTLPLFLKCCNPWKGVR